MSYQPTPPSAIGQIDYLPIRTAFPHEAAHFTTWMEENIERLTERINMELTVVQREKSVGAFNVDLLCEDGDGNPVVIENQLEQTDHDHLGKLLTYLVNLDAASAIWVTSEPRAEHAKVIDWLNESTPNDISFYLVKAEAVTVDGSAPAPLFTLVAAPSAQIKDAGHQKKEWAEGHRRRIDFWTGLLERSKSRTNLFANVGAVKESYLTTGAGRQGINFSYNIFKDGAAIELYIDNDTKSGAGNKAIFDQLLAQREDIEHECGVKLAWHRLDEKRASKVRWAISVGGLLSPDEWPNLQDRMIDAMIKFEAAFRPRLAQVKT